MADYGDVLARLRVLIKEGTYYGPVTEDEVARVENELGINVAGSYRIFLTHFGAAWGRPPYELAGITDNLHNERDNPPTFQHIVPKTLNLRRASRGNLPPAWLPISDDGTDWKFYLDTTTVDEQGESPILVLGPGLEGVTSARSFVEFVEKTYLGDPFPTPEK